MHVLVEYIVPALYYYMQLILSWAEKIVIPLRITAMSHGPWKIMT